MADSSPLVSIILPTYNRAASLARAVSSVLNQSYADFELIVVDDASTDATAEVLHQFSDERLRCLSHPENRGANAARNTGIRASRGRLIAFQDSDDAWLADKLDKQLAVLSHAPPSVGVVFCAYRRIWENDRQQLFPARLRRLSSKLPLASRRLDGDIQRALLRGNFVTTQTTVVRQECFERVGLFDERLFQLQEWELWLRISRYYTFHYVDQPLVDVYYTPGSLSTDLSALPTSFEIILQNYPADLPLKRLLQAHYSFMMGDLLCWQGDFKQGRRRFLDALRLHPGEMIHLIAFFASFLGPGIYNYLANILAFRYA